MARISGQFRHGTLLAGLRDAHLTGLTLLDIVQLFPDEVAAIKWFKVILWLDGRCTLPAKVTINTGIHRQAGQYEFALFNRRFSEARH